MRIKLTFLHHRNSVKTSKWLYVKDEYGNYNKFLICRKLFKYVTAVLIFFHNLITIAIFVGYMQSDYPFFITGTT